MPVFMMLSWLLGCLTLSAMATFALMFLIQYFGLVWWLYRIEGPGMEISTSLGDYIVHPSEVGIYVEPVVFIARKRFWGNVWIEAYKDTESKLWTDSGPETTLAAYEKAVARYEHWAKQIRLTKKALAERNDRVRRERAVEVDSVPVNSRSSSGKRLSTRP